MGGRGLIPVTLAATLAASLLLATAAEATFHLMKIREVHTGGASGGSYVELQMWTGGQNAVGGHPIRVYNANGSVAHTFTFGSGVADGQSQATILVAGTGYATAFPSGPTPDATDAGLNLPAAGGAVCFTEGTPPDCVSWGNFTGAASLPSPTGTPASAGGVTTGKALHRSIAAGCSTLLEEGDDTDNSAEDFSEQNPNPRSNSSSIVEAPCPSLPNTTITGGKPADPTKSTGASFSFSASPSAGASFECKLDGEAGFTSCSSPKAYTDLSEANHTFEVRAVNSAGADPTPASHKWRIDLTPPTATILTKPADPSPGKSTSFTYSSSESNSKFECRLTPVEASFTACNTQPKVYSNLANGEYEFELRAIDAAGNVQAASTAFPWTVDNSLADETPPQTTIKARPPDPSGSSTATFQYGSDEPGSSFECKLDGGAFANCGSMGVTYTGLANGPHSFQVRARDPSGNVDPSPAGYSWAVSVAATIDPPPAFPPPRSPQTIITRKPGAVTRDRTPTFRFRSSIAGSSFQCKVDRAAFKRCSSPFTTRKLPFGAHALQVRALAAGSLDPSPAKSRFRVTKPKRRTQRQ